MKCSVLVTSSEHGDPALSDPASLEHFNHMISNSFVVVVTVCLSEFPDGSIPSQEENPDKCGMTRTFELTCCGRQA